MGNIWEIYGDPLGLLGKIFHLSRKEVQNIEVDFQGIQGTKSNCIICKSKRLGLQFLVGG